MNRPKLAKLSPPRLVDVAPRKRLFGRIDELARAASVWVTAPAGSGKSALVASYLEARDLIPIWYNIDARDHDVAALFEGLTESLAALAPDKAATLPRFGVESLPALTAFARRFFELLQRALPERAVLVFDDYHELGDSSPFHELTRLALATLPPERCALLISRGAPPASLAREVAHGTLRLLEGAELSLTLEEARAVGRLRGAQAVHEGTIDAAHERAEGWLVGFLLLLDPAAPRLDRVSETTLFDYFAAEILGKMPIAAQRALFAAALLPVFDDEALADIAGPDGAVVNARAPARAGLFLVAQSEVGSQANYRFHALFRAFLLQCVPRLLEPLEQRALEARAAALCERLGHHDEAVALHARAAEFSSVARLIISRAPELFARGQCRTLASWLALLPRADVEQDGWLSYWQATAGLFSGAPPDEARATYALARACFEASADLLGAALASAGSIQAVVYAGQNFRALDDSMRFLASVPLAGTPLPVDLELQIVSSMVLALSFREGEVQGLHAPRWLDRALELASATGSASQRRLVLGQLLFYRALRGEMAETALLTLRIERALEQGNSDPIATCTVHLARALTAWLEANEDACIAEAEAGLEVCEENGIAALRDVLLVYATFGALGKEDPARVQGYLKQLGHLADTGRPLDSGNYHALVAWAALDRADLPAARLALEKSEAAARTLGGGFGLALNRLLAAQLEFMSGNRLASRARLAEAEQVEAIIQNPGLVYWRKLVEADLAARAGETEAADAALREAFARGRTLGIYNALWPERRRLAELCVRALDAGIEPEYARQLAQRRRLVFKRPPLAREAWPFRLEVRLFGQLGVLVDGRELRFGAKLPKVPLALLVALVVLGHDGRELSIELLSDQLWPDAEADAALHAFETTLYRLRKLLGDETLIPLDSGRLRLDPALVTSDYSTCLRLLSRVERAQKEGASAHSLDADGARLRAFRNAPFLEGWSQAWVIRERERLRRRLDTALGLPRTAQ